MTVANQAEQLKINAINIRSVLTSGNYVVKKNRKRLADLNNREDQAQAKNLKEQKIESKKSVFGSALKKIGKSILSGPMGIFDKILEFASLLLFGVVINNIEAIQEKITEWMDNIKKAFEPIGKFVSIMYKGGKSFVDWIAKTLPQRQVIDKAMKEIDWDKVRSQMEELNGIIKATSNMLGITEGPDGGIDLKTNIPRDENDPSKGNMTFSETLSNPENDIVTVDGVSTGNTALQLGREKFYMDQYGDVRRHSDNKKANWPIIFQFPSVDKDQLEKIEYNPVKSVKTSSNVDTLGNRASIGRNDTIYIINRPKVKVVPYPIPMGVA